MPLFKNIIITGASSGIGAALAKQYANKDITLFLQGRDQKRLQNIATICRSKGAKIIIAIIDVVDEAAMRQWINSITDEYIVDLVIANAGISAGMINGSESEQAVRQLFSVNLNGVLNTILPVIPTMQNHRKGQIAIMSSLAAYRGMPGCPAYSASKAAIKIYGEAIRGVLAKDNVGVTVITPGYIRTPLTDVNKFPMPFIISAEQAANKIINRLAINPPRIAFPLFFYFIVWFFACLSPAITDFIYSKLPGKNN
jgi:short-subunit dehydrogenase